MVKDLNKISLNCLTLYCRMKHRCLISDESTQLLVIIILTCFLSRWISEEMFVLSFFYPLLFSQSIKCNFIDAQSFSNSFEGVFGIVRKSRLGVLYFRAPLHFYDQIFQSLLRGYMRCHPHPPPPPTCVIKTIR